MSNMFTLNQIKILRKLWDTSPPNMQLIIAVEELAELQQVLCKILRFGDDHENRQKLYEEYADVQIMMEQIRMMFSLNEGILQNRRNSKLALVENKFGHVLNNGR